MLSSIVTTSLDNQRVRQEQCRLTGKGVRLLERLVVDSESDESFLPDSVVTLNHGGR